LDYAQTHDSDEAEALLDIAEDKDAEAVAKYNAAKAFFDKLVSEEVLDEEDRGDMVGAVPEKANDESTTDAVVAAVDNAIDVDEMLAKAETLTEE
jgi:hypothetical protein